jgi:hypothetical protein
LAAMYLERATNLGCLEVLNPALLPLRGTLAKSPEHRRSQQFPSGDVCPASAGSDNVLSPTRRAVLSREIEKKVCQLGDKSLPEIFATH